MDAADGCSLGKNGDPAKMPALGTLCKTRTTVGLLGAAVDWITEEIAIGNFIDAQDADLILREKIASALSLDASLHRKKPSELGLKRIEVVNLEDGPGNHPRSFIQAVAYLDELVCDFPPVLVQCHAGRSRSVVVVAGHLMRSKSLSAEEAIAFVASKRDVAVAPGLELLLDHL